MSGIPIQKVGAVSELFTRRIQNEAENIAPISDAKIAFKLHKVVEGDTLHLTHKFPAGAEVIEASVTRPGFEEPSGKAYSSNDLNLNDIVWNAYGKLCRNERRPGSNWLG